jgi:hypothetical protein
MELSSGVSGFYIFHLFCPMLSFNFNNINRMPDSSTQDIEPKAQDQKVQNPEFAHEKPPIENSEPKPKSQDALTQPLSQKERGDSRLSLT